MERVETLVAEMTLAEKIGQLNMVASTGVVTGPSGSRATHQGIRAGTIGGLFNLWGADEVRAVQRIAVEESRLGVPLLLGLDVIHGHRTIFPVPLAEACAFDVGLWERTARAAAEEAAADGIAMTFAPMIDVARDPRWGRIVESPGEDPWVASELAAAKTRGFQGGDLAAADSVAATAKHLCAYGAVTAGREYASVDVSERTLREIYLPPFSAAVAAGTAAIMPAFIDIAGVPMTINPTLLKGWLRERVGFDGVLISDYNAVAELINHGVAADSVEAAALALNAGVDIDMTSNTYTQGLPAALDRGLVTMADIEASVRRVLRLKERLGLFADPYRRGSAAPDDRDGKSRRLLAREAARRAIVLLTHRCPILPLSPNTRRIAVVGPLATAREEMLGSWASAGRPADVVSILEGLKAAMPDCRIDDARGVDIDGEDERGVAVAIDLCAHAEIIVLCLGESAAMSGEAASRTNLGLPGRQRALAEAVLGLGKPTVVLLSSGRPLALSWLFERADAVLATWFLGIESGHAIADVLTGKFNPSGRLPLSWLRSVGQAPIYFSQRPTGRPTTPGVHYSSSYLDMLSTPQFPFGHGLSYSRFVLSNLRCEPAVVKAGEEVQVSLEVRNDGPIGGEVTLFLFVRDLVASVARPVLELKGVRKLTLGADENRQATWRLPAQALAFIGENLEPVLEAGRFEIHVGQTADPAGFLTGVIELAT
ncbi:MAG: glycoside hydrolase family 3 N-terminal domain-containing protein [Roseiarcus sp.]|uniref:glycoside hydrolase family 3 N-terminal domain-containing protein n=1 Tax=Roseiarcus sp. TaxID=1969460 RepID=UPI003BAF7353